MNERFKAPSRASLFLIVFGVVILDALTKQVVIARLPLGASVQVLPKLLHVVHYENPGAAFNVFSASANGVGFGLLLLFSCVAVIVVTVLFCRSRSIRKATIGLALVLGGAIGNLAERLLHGAVVDFIDVSVRSHHWPAFNVADSAIVLGAVLILLDLLSKPVDIEGPSAVDSPR